MVVKIQGGMGNQLFQAAYGMTHNAKFDRSGIYFPRQYALEPFNLAIEFEDNCPDAEVGYWQSEKYFDHELIRREFSCPFPKPMIDAVAIHVRLTDNLSERAKAFHGDLLETEYYDAAINEFSIKKKLYVFSDDPIWCIHNLPWNCEVVSGKSDCEDLWEMARFKHIIIANSSFSWWAAWLGDAHRGDGKVICPTRWFVGDADASGICPSRWIKL